MKEGSNKFNELAARFFLSSRFDTLLLLVVITLAIGTVFYNTVEGWGFLDSLYFSVITLTTVGYGDLAPVTSIGRLFTIFYVMIGIGILLGFINFITDQALKYKIREKSEEDIKRKAVKVIKERKIAKRKAVRKKNKK